MNPIGELTTTRPMGNPDRESIWRNKLSSPPQEQPQSVTATSVVLGALGFVLVIGALMVLVWVAAERMGVL